MFLISTAEQRFWRDRDPVLFLGEWCRQWPLRHVWQKLRHEVVPYHWDDRAKLRADCEYLDGLYERLLSEFSVLLNEQHGIQQSTRYWRIVLGPWLFAMICIAFDRWESVRWAAASGRVRSTLVGRYAEEAWVLRDHLDFSRLSFSDAFNQFLFSRIIRDTGAFPFNEIDIPDETMARLRLTEQAHRLRPSLKAIAVEAVARLARFVPSQHNQIVLIDSCLEPRDLARLQLSMGQFPYLLQPPVPQVTAPVDGPRRRALTIGPGYGDFERWLARYLVDVLPTSYLEGFAEAKRRALAAYPKQPKVIFTAYAYDANEPFKFWAAEQVDRGAKLVGTQHGCHYGTAAWFQEERHQLAIYDRFYSWGWSDASLPFVQPLAAAKFNRLKRVVEPKPDGRILFTGYVFPRYAYKLYSVPISASGTVGLLEQHVRFALSLSAEGRRLLLVRLCPGDRDWMQRDRWADAVPDAECYAGPQTMIDQMSDSRLMVTVTGSTPHLEALTANYPCIAFADHAVFEIRPSAQPYYDDLRAAGMIFDSAKAAAAKVDEIKGDVGAWWNGPDVQRARLNFVGQFARSSPNWRDEWLAELRALAGATGLLRPADAR